MSRSFREPGAPPPEKPPKIRFFIAHGEPPNRRKPPCGPLGKWPVKFEAKPE